MTTFVTTVRQHGPSITAGLTLAAGGSIADALQAGAISIASMGVFAAAGAVGQEVAGAVISGLQLAGAAAEVALTAVKAGIHGIASGALSVAQGGSFSQGFVGGAIGAVGGQFSQGVFGNYGDGVLGNQLGRAAISAIAGCGGAVFSGGKCANGAVTAAFASLYNGDSLGRKIFKFGLKKLGPVGVAAQIAAKTHLTYKLRACETCPVAYVDRTSGLNAGIDRILYGRWSGHTHNDS